MFSNSDNEFLEKNTRPIIDGLITMLLTQTSKDPIDAIIMRMMNECNGYSIEGIASNLESIPYQSALLYNECRKAYHRITKLTKTQRHSTSIGNMTATLLQQLCKTCYKCELLIDALQVKTKCYLSILDFTSLILTAKIFREFCTKSQALYNEFRESPMFLIHALEVIAANSPSRNKRHSEPTSKSLPKHIKSLSFNEFMEQSVKIFISKLELPLESRQNE